MPTAEREPQTLLASDVGEGQSVVALEGVVRRWRNGRGVGPLSLSLSSGETVVAMGPNGAGKTTLLRIIATRERPSTGTVQWWGSTKARRAWPRLGVGRDIPDEEATLTPQEIARFWCARWMPDRAVRDAAVEEMLSKCGLDDVAKDPLGGFSLGMRRRLMLCVALAHRPALALLDEPSAGLDPDGVTMLTALLDERRKAGLTTLVASNDAAFATRVADRVLMLVDGQARACDSPTRLIASLKGHTVARIQARGEVDHLALVALAGVWRVSLDPSTHEVVVEYHGAHVLAAIVAALGDKAQLAKISVAEPTLDDYFASIAGSTGHAKKKGAM